MSQNIQLPFETRPQFIQIDEDGYFVIDGLRVAEEDSGRSWLSSLKVDDRGQVFCRMGEKTVFVESFDEPLVALGVEKNSDGTWQLKAPYGLEFQFQISTLTLDEWDRFHGKTKTGIPFVLSRNAQNSFFNQVDEFEDDAVTVDGHRYEMSAWLQDNEVSPLPSFWTDIYKTNETPWDLERPSHALPTLVPRLKLQKVRVLVAGCGAGHDAAWFAQQGHIVTGIDFSDEAIERAKKLYGHLPNLQFKVCDVFQMPSIMRNSFDLIFEHTLYCAINPSQRNELVRSWRRALVDGGYLMGVFFVGDKRTGPPFGGSEWELRSRLQKGFLSLYWTRLRDSVAERLGSELFVYAQKKNALS